MQNKSCTEGRANIKRLQNPNKRAPLFFLIRLYIHLDHAKADRFFGGFRERESERKKKKIMKERRWKEIGPGRQYGGAQKKGEGERWEFVTDEIHVS